MHEVHFYIRLHLSIKVKFWMTHNEPWVIAHHGYETADHAPLLKGQGYKAGHNLIRAHTKAYQLYVTKYKKTQKGKFKVLNSTFFFSGSITKHMC